MLENTIPLSGFLVVLFTLGEVIMQFSTRLVGLG